MFDCLFALIFFPLFIVGADDGTGGVIVAVDSSFNELQC